MRHKERNPETGRYEHQYDWVPEEYGYKDINGNTWAGGSCSICGAIQEHGGAPIAPAEARRRMREMKEWRNDLRNIE